MHIKEITVNRIAHTAIDQDELQIWLDKLGAHEFELPACSDEEGLVGVAAKRCYMSFEPGLNPNVTKIRKDWFDYLNNILSSGHGSVLEHASSTFAIEGITRVGTGELNRHRAGVAISEGSMRYIRFEDIGFWMPESLKLTDEEKIAYNKAIKYPVISEAYACIEPENLHGKDLEVWMSAHRKTETQKIFRESFERQEQEQVQLAKLWDIDNQSFSKKKQLTSMSRRLIGMGVSTGGVWTMNMRALRHIIALRSSPHAEEEIAIIAGKIAKIMCQDVPGLFNDFEEKDGTWTPKYLKV